MLINEFLLLGHASKHATVPVLRKPSPLQLRDVSSFGGTTSMNATPIFPGTLFLFVNELLPVLIQVFNKTQSETLKYVVFSVEQILGPKFASFSFNIRLPRYTTMLFYAT